jgi:hypothetical protein
VQEQGDAIILAGWNVADLLEEGGLNVALDQLLLRSPMHGRRVLSDTVIGASGVGWR